MSEQQKPPPGFSAFKQFLEKLAKVPKGEIDEREREYQKIRETAKAKKRA